MRLTASELRLVGLRQRFVALLALLSCLACSALGGEYYDRFLAALTNESSQLPAIRSPLLVDTNNTTLKVTNVMAALTTDQGNAAFAGIRFDMTMEEVVALWGKPRSLYSRCFGGPRLCYAGASVIFEPASNRVFRVRMEGWPHREDVGSPELTVEECLKALGEPTSSHQESEDSFGTLVYETRLQKLTLWFAQGRLFTVTAERPTEQVSAQPAGSVTMSDAPPADEDEAAKKERRFQRLLQELRNAMTSLQTNRNDELNQAGVSNYLASAEHESLVRTWFEESWIHSSFGRYWDEVPPPTLTNEPAMASVRSYLATNGWNMWTNPPIFSFIQDREHRRFPPIRGLPWEVLKDREFSALTHSGILYVVLRPVGRFGSAGVAYDPNTNRLPRTIHAYKPLAGHWYTWAQSEDGPGALLRRYEGQSETNLTRGASASPMTNSRPDRVTAPASPAVPPAPP